MVISDKVIESALKRLDHCISKMQCFSCGESGRKLFSPFHTGQYSIFLYYLSNELSKNEKQKAAMVYYLNKIMHATDWFYEIELPPHFGVEHPLGSVMGKAQYGDYLFFYQGTTIGGNRRGDRIYYPVLGNNVLLYSNSSVLGSSKIGSNVIVSTGCCIKNEEIPDGSIVFGSSPNLAVKRKTENQIKDMTKHIWKW